MECGPDIQIPDLYPGRMHVGTYSKFAALLADTGLVAFTLSETSVTAYTVSTLIMFNRLQWLPYVLYGRDLREARLHL